MNFQFHPSTKCNATSSISSDGIIGYHHQEDVFVARGNPYNTNASCAMTTSNSANPRCSTETAVSEALLTLSSAGPNAGNAKDDVRPTFQSPSHPPASSSLYSLATPQSQHPLPPQQRRPSGPALRRVSLCSPVAASGYPQSQQPQQQQQQWAQVFVPQQQAGNFQMVGAYETPKRAPSPALFYVARPMVAEGAPPAKKARTVSPLPASESFVPQTTNINPEEVANCVSSICPVCNIPIKGLGEHKVDWSQPVQGRQRAKTITSIKKHVKDFHPNEPIWCVIVNSISTTEASQRVVTAPAFVAQALKKAALDQIPNQPQHLRSLRWTEKMLDVRIGVAKGFVMFGGMEYLRGKECQDELGQKINPKSLRNLAYSLLQNMYDDLMAKLAQHQHSLQAAMATDSLGLLRNRFQLLFAAPEKWNESWYMDPAKYSSNSHQC